MQVTILGENYVIKYALLGEDKTLEQCDAYCDFSVKGITVREFTEAERAEADSQKDIEAYKHKCLRHEIIHAFLYESGLSVNSNDVLNWATNEEMVD